MSTSPAALLDTDHAVGEDFNCASSVTSQALISRTDIPPPSLSPSHFRTTSHMITPDSNSLALASEGSSIETSTVYVSSATVGLHNGEDVVGEYLEWRDRHILEGFQATIAQHIDTCAGYTIRGHQSESLYDSYPYGNAQRWYPDTDAIRHLHALHSLLSHISPERKLNALSGLEIDIIDGSTNKVLCHAVPKKLLVLFLGRHVVSKFIRTFQREANDAWRGLPTDQKLVLPPKVASSAAIKIVVSWLARACRFATMRSMEPLRIPKNLFVACSLARTVELFQLHRDAYRLDVAIKQKFSSERPIFAVEIETMYRCLGEHDKYVYACVRALSVRISDLRVAEELQGLARRCPGLYARLCDSALNERYKPQIGREWFGKLSKQKAAQSGIRVSGTAVLTIPARTWHPDAYWSSEAHVHDVKPLNPSAPVFQPAGIGA